FKDFLEALQAFDHEAGTRAPRTSTVPPFAAIFARADSLTACAFTVSAWATSPSPRILTRARSLRRIKPAVTSASGSTTAFAANRPRASRFTIAYSVLPPWGTNPRFGSRRSPSALTVASCLGERPMMERERVILSLLLATGRLLHHRRTIAAPPCRVQVLQALDLAERVERRLEDVVRVVRAERLGED